MLILHNPKHHHHFTWQHVSIMYCFAGVYKKCSSINTDELQNKVHVVWARLSNKELYGGDESHVILVKGKGRDRDIGVLPGTVA